MDLPSDWERELFGSNDTNQSLDENDVGEEAISSSFNSTEILEDGIHEQTSAVGVVPPSTSLSVSDDRSRGEVCPQPGTLFANEESLFRAYQDHAKYKGFCVTKRASRCLTPNGYKYSVWQCDRGRKSSAQKTSKRVDCKAHVNGIRQDDGSWKVGKVVEDHNHELCPTMSILMPAHRSLTVNLKRQLEANDIAGIRVCKNVRLAEVQAGGPQNMGCLPKDCRNYVDARRRLRLGEGDAEAMRRLFLRLHEKERDFFHIMDIGDDSRLRNVLWIHPRSKAAYEDFHDVVSFDTTYLVNRYKMPFATVVGVNHHGQSILLGCALVTHEDADSFKWLFANWLEAMDGIQPTCIITDQYESIKIAIRGLMPNTIHRYCLWHILCKLPVKFKGIQNYHTAIKDFKELIYESRSIHIFETRWAEFLSSYGLEANEWLRNMYAERESWVPAFLNHHFWAGMTSTQRSEGMHAFFDGYINSRCTLKQFVEQYEISIVDKIHREFLADFDSKYKVMNRITDYPWEIQFRAVYTNKLFGKLQDQIRRGFYCHTVEEVVVAYDNLVNAKKFKVIESIFRNGHHVKDFTYWVEYRLDGQYLNCGCRCFEFRGIMCCHILKVMCKENIRDVHSRYILHRWRKDVYRRHSGIFFAGGYPHMTSEYKKYQEIERCFQECTDVAMGSDAKMGLIRERLRELKDDLISMEHSSTQNQNDSQRNTTGESPIAGNPIRNPEVTRTCGRPRGTRIPSRHEVRGGTRGVRGCRGRSSGRRGRHTNVVGSNIPDLNDVYEMSIGSLNF